VQRWGQSVFYILTCGSTASVWLSRALCYHPEIVCFHGVRTLSGDSTNGAEPQAKKFARDLERLYYLSQGEQIFGAIHGFGAMEIAPEIAASGGTFLAMMRHPITRLDSLFHRVTEVINGIDPSCEDIYETLKENRQRLSSSDNSTTDLFTVHARKFDEMCKNMLAEDTFIFSVMDERDVIQYEKIVHEPQYFRACFERLAEGCRKAMAVSRTRSEGVDPIDPAIERPLRGKLSLECTQDYLDRVFNIGVMNTKSRAEYSPAEIFERWPSRFKETFIDHLKDQGGQVAAARYARYGYDLPNEVVGISKRKRTRAPAIEAPAEENSSDRFLRAIIEMERTAHSDKLRELNQVQHAEREAFVARIYELQSTLEAERAASIARINELQTTLNAEREAFTARINELQTSLDAERAALGLKNIFIRFRRLRLLARRTLPNHPLRGSNPTQQEPSA
jgi:hypothetical protein